MKKFALFLLAFFWLINLAQSQLKVLNNGNVGIGTTSPDRLLTVGGTSNPIIGYKTLDGKGWAAYAQNNLNFSIFEYTNTGWSTGYDRLTINRGGRVSIGTPTTDYGKLQINGSGYPNGLSVWNETGTAINIIHNSDDNAYIIRGSSTNAGIRLLNNGHVGINGYASATYWLYVTGDCRANTWSTYSDSTAKTDIKDITISERIKELRPISFRWKEDILVYDENSEASNSFVNETSESIILCDTCSSLVTDKDIIKTEIIPEIKDVRVHYGFLAQDVQKIFPDVVTSDERGQLAIDYNAFIPMLVDCYKNADLQINALQQIVAKQEEEIQQLISINESSKKSYSSNESKDNSEPLLYQNTPNPFNVGTVIKYNVPTLKSKAIINVYDLQGIQIKSFGINQTGQGEIRIQALTLVPGIYIYNLIVDGSEVDTRRMILTD